MEVSFVYLLCGRMSIQEQEQMREGQYQKNKPQKALVASPRGKYKQLTTSTRILKYSRTPRILMCL